MEAQAKPKGCSLANDMGANVMSPKAGTNRAISTSPYVPMKSTNPQLHLSLPLVLKEEKFR
jgi:hypothetical protein